MNAQVDRAVKSLFPEGEAAPVNVKFFLGHARVVTAEQLAQQLNRADAQIRNGLAKASPLDSGLTVTAL